MKRLLAIILSFFYAVTNNTAVIHSDNQDFKINSYYIFEDEDSFTPSELEDRKSRGTEQVSAEPIQSTNPFKSTSGVYWITELKYQDIDKWTNTQSQILWGTGIYKNKRIVMPEEAKITEASPTTGRIVLQNDNYKFVFENVDRFYCYLGVKANSDGTWPSLPTEFIGTSLKGGCVVGLAQDGTTLTIYKSGGSKVTPKDYFG